MITDLQYELVKALLRFDNAREIIYTALREYSRIHPDEVTTILDLNSNIVIDNIHRWQNQEAKDYNRMNYLVGILYSKNKNYEVNSKGDFVTALSACETLCPMGNNAFASPVVKKYFNSMVKYFQDHKDEYIDSNWANDYNHNEYLHAIADKKVL